MISDHAEYEVLVPAYVLGVADPVEARKLRDHLRGCDACTRLTGRLQRAASLLPLELEPAEAPAHLRERLLRAAAEEAGADSRSRRVIPLPKPPPRAPRRLLPAVRRATALAVAAAFALGLGAGLGTRLIPPAPSEARYTLQGTGAMAGAEGRVADLRSDGVTVVWFSGLPQPAPGHVDELWLIPRQGQPQAAAVFVPNAGGSQVVLLPRSVAGLKALAVTEEPGPNGSSQPTQQPQLIGSIS
jgi:anti-sigma-K factor RskA